MRDFNHYRFSFENQFFKYLKGQITLSQMISNLYEYENKARQEYLNDNNGVEDIKLELYFRFFKGEAGLNSINDLENNLGIHANINNKKIYLGLMSDAISFDMSFELQIYLT